MKHLWASLLFSALLGACASAPAPQPRPDSLLDDAAFAPSSERIDANVFAVSDAMRSYLNKDIAHQLRERGYQRGLIEALYQRNQLKLEYDSARTRNAADAFDARAGNCLSLVIMTAALAKELGMAVTFQSASTEETWSRNGGIYFRSGHVNVTLGRRIVEIGGGVDFHTVTIDFLPPEDVRGLHTSPISEAVVVAMYMNNRAAEALAQNRLADAYWWAREALLRNPDFLIPYNTLGVIYRRTGDLARAEKVYAHVLAREPGNTRSMSNLAQVLEQAGRGAEAAQLRARLAVLEPDPPFHFFNLGMAAMQRADFSTARDLFAREVARADYNNEFHYWLGLAEFRLGDFAEARKQLALAVENSANRGERDLYSAKLAWLKSNHYATP